MRHGILIIFVFQILFSCTPETIIDSKNFDFKEGWNFTNSLVAEFNDLDESHNSINVSLRLKYLHDFPYENIYLRTTIISQNDTIVKEVKSFELQNEVGQWKGKKVGNGYSIKYPLINSSKTSNLRIEVEQYSRDQILMGIESAEIIIEQSE